jgi:hypothetical protein
MSVTAIVLQRLFLENRYVLRVHWLPRWREFYRAALFETDQQKLPAHIAEAERALILRARALSAMSGDNSEEGQALEDALYALRALRNCLELKTGELKGQSRLRLSSFHRE